MERLSDKEPQIKKARQIAVRGIELYSINQSEAAVAHLKESAKIFENFKFKYPNSLELYFYLLEAYEGINSEIVAIKDDTIQYLDNLLQNINEYINQKKYKRTS